MRTHPHARTPEELETLFEDALVLRDSAALAALFEMGATLVAGGDRPARGGEESALRALATWGPVHPYLAGARNVLATRDLALRLGADGAHVMRRDRDGSWRYAIVWQFARGDLRKEAR